MFRHVVRPGESPDGPSRGGRETDRRLLALALPAFGALVAEPLFVLVDSAVVGHLGTPQLAGLSLAGTVLVTLVGLFVFLAYATTAATARLIGAGDERGALAVGVDGMWLAAGLGVVLAAAGWLAAPATIHALGASSDVAPHAVAYRRVSLPGLPGMLVVLAATGALRGRQDTRTPFLVAALGAGVNAALNVALVYGAGLGIAGSGLGTALTQTAMGAVLGATVVRAARRSAVPLRPAARGIVSAAAAGLPLLVRTLSLRAAILLTVMVAASLGDIALAAHQVVAALWSLAAFALDALAIAAQTLVGRSLGAGDRGAARSLTRRTVAWGTVTGAVLGLVMAASGWWLAPLVTADDDVRRAAALALAVAGACLPVAGLVYVLDGVLIGAGDGRYLALAGVATLAGYVPLLAAVWLWAPGGGPGLAWLWASFAGGFMVSRAALTGLRARGDRWLVLGAVRAR
jgi:putative MATE family efflux protein